MDKFMEELQEMNLEAVVQRIADMDKEVRESEDEALIAERTEQKRMLLERKAELEDIEARKQTAKGIEEGKVETQKVEEHREGKKMTNAEVRNTAEYIDAYANYIKTGKDEECRKLLTEDATNGSVPIPDIVPEYVNTAWDREGIMQLVKKSYLKGNLRVGFELSATGAVVHTEGADAPAEETLVIGTVSIVPKSIKKWIRISDEVMDLKGEEFLRYIYDELTYQIAKKAAEELIDLIELAGTVSTSTSVGIPKITEASIGLGTVANAISQLSDEAENVAVAMNKQTWAKFKAVQYSGNYSVDPFEGRPVVFNNHIKSYDAATTGETYAIVGDFGRGALANFPNGEEINFKFDDLSEAEADLVKIVGREYVGLGIVAPGSFVKVVK